jgi:hypothetical protein
MENIFIFRMAKGNDSGTPIGHCPLDYTDIKKEIAKLKQEDIKQIQYEDEDFKKLYIEFLYKELWNNNILRQDWGIKDLDLNQKTPTWIKNYMYNGKIFWNTNIECHTAKGRWNIISRMLAMKKDDFIIIPKTSNNIDRINDYEHFTICQVDEPYYFDYQEHIKDFGHCIKVKNLKVFEYSNKTLLRNDFSAPYLWAITKVENSHSRYGKFRNFCKN